MLSKRSVWIKIKNLKWNENLRPLFSVLLILELHKILRSNIKLVKENWKSFDSLTNKKNPIQYSSFSKIVLILVLYNITITVQTFWNAIRNNTRMWFLSGWEFVVAVCWPWPAARPLPSCWLPLPPQQYRVEVKTGRSSTHQLLPWEKYLIWGTLLKFISNKK